MCMVQWTPNTNYRVFEKKLLQGKSMREDKQRSRGSASPRHPHHLQMWMQLIVTVVHWKYDFECWECTLMVMICRPSRAIHCLHCFSRRGCGRVHVTDTRMRGSHCRISLCHGSWSRSMVFYKWITSYWQDFPITDPWIIVEETEQTQLHCKDVKLCYLSMHWWHISLRSHGCKLLRLVNYIHQMSWGS